ADESERRRAVTRLLRDLTTDDGDDDDDEIDGDLESAEGLETSAHGLAAPLLDIQPLVINGTEPVQVRGEWALLTGAALSSDMLTDLRAGGQASGADEADLWAALRHPGRAVAAARSLYVYGQAQELRLDMERCAILDSLLDEGLHDLVAEVLAVASLS